MKDFTGEREEETPTTATARLALIFSTSEFAAINSFESSLWDFAVDASAIIIEFYCCFLVACDLEGDQGPYKTSYLFCDGSSV